MDYGLAAYVYESLSGYVVHMARQLPTDRWTSKLGGLEDIEHASPAELEGREYGIVVQYMRRAAQETGRVRGRYEAKNINQSEQSIQSKGSASFVDAEPFIV